MELSFQSQVFVLSAEWKKSVRGSAFTFCTLRGHDWETFYFRELQTFSSVLSEKQGVVQNLWDNVTSLFFHHYIWCCQTLSRCPDQRSRELLYVLVLWKSNLRSLPWWSLFKMEMNSTHLCHADWNPPLFLFLQVVLAGQATLSLPKRIFKNTENKRMMLVSESPTTLQSDSQVRCYLRSLWASFSRRSTVTLWMTGLTTSVGFLQYLEMILWIPLSLLMKSNWDKSSNFRLFVSNAAY